MRNVFDEIDNVRFEKKIKKEPSVTLRTYDRDTIWDMLKAKPKTGGYYDTEHFKNKVRLEEIRGG